MDCKTRNINSFTKPLLFFSFSKGIALNPFQPGFAFHIETSHLFDLEWKSNDWFLHDAQHLAKTS